MLSKMVRNMLSNVNACKRLIKRREGRRRFKTDKTTIAGSQKCIRMNVVVVVEV